MDARPCSVGEGESCRIGEASRRAVNDLGDQCKRLQGARAESLNQQQGCKIAKLLFVSECQYGAETFQVNILCANIVMRRHRQFACFTQRRLTGSFAIVSSACCALAARAPTDSESPLAVYRESRHVGRRQSPARLQSASGSDARNGSPGHPLLHDSPFA